MNEGNITVTLTESQHELINDMIMSTLEAFNVMSPWGDGMEDLPFENAILQRYDMVENLKSLFDTLWADRFN
jgi:hypothetical protein